MNAPTKRVIRIGGASGAWGDSPMGLEQLVAADVDFLMMDYLAEVTMSLLARARLKNPDAGYPPDLVGYLAPHLRTIAERGIRVVTNGGGVNPRAAQRALQEAATAAGVALRIAVVEGDDLMPMQDALRAADTREWKSGEPLPQRLLTMNAYLGAAPIAAALDAGAHVVITGRSADSALALGALVHAFGWSLDDHDRMSAGSLVGHLLECGPQVTGGVFTDWESVPDWHDIGYPIAECTADGRFTITKPDGTGGLVTPATVGEQVLYEIGDPRRYLLPDVTADFSQVRLTADGPSRVVVDGARGTPPSDRYKVSATWQDGYRAVAMVAIVGVDAARKAVRTGEALVARAHKRFADRGLPDFAATHLEVLGAEASYGAGSRALASREVVLRLVVEHRDAKALDLFARELGSVGLSFAQGTAGLIGGRPKPSPVIRLFTFLVDKAALPPPTFAIGDGPAVEVPIPAGVPDVVDAVPEPVVERGGDEADLVDVPLIRVAHARSGDKGDASNIAILCRRRDYVDHLRRVLTTDRIRAHFANEASGAVVRYEAPGLAAFNFLIDDALGGGGMASRRIDPQGKAYGQRALEMIVPVPRRWLDAPAG